MIREVLSFIACLLMISACTLATLSIAESSLAYQDLVMQESR